MTTLTDVKEANPQWFDRGNKRFFGDVSYKVLHGKKSKKPFLVRSTYAWTDMFGGTKRLHWRVNLLKDNLKIDNLIDKQFLDLDDVKDWLADN
jgi:hypothetical protein